MAPAVPCENQGRRILGGDTHVLGPLSFWPLTFVVLNGLALLEAVIAAAFDRGGVEEDLSLLPLNEPKAFVR